MAFATLGSVCLGLRGMPWDGQDALRKYETVPMAAAFVSQKGKNLNGTNGHAMSKGNGTLDLRIVRCAQTHLCKLDGNATAFHLSLRLRRLQAAGRTQATADFHQRL